jgi:hypothetical protein
MCLDKARCHRNLTEHSAAKHYREYCLNASTLETLDQTAATAH